MNKKINLFFISITLGALFFLGFLYKSTNKISSDLENIYPIKIEKKFFINRADKNLFTKDNSRLSILFTGDIMLDRSVLEKTIQSGKSDYDFPFQFINSSTNKFDLRIANLEGPITDNKSIVSPEKLVFTFSPKYLKALSKNFDILNLANNHSNNFGSQGFLQTKKYLEENNLDFFGSPDNSSSSLSLVIEKNDFKIAFVAFNDLFDFDFQIILKEVQKLVLIADYIIVFPHWGREYEFRPSDNQINKAHQLIDCGADLLIGTHPHVIQSVENYQDKIIFYSLGNFIFDQYFSEETMTGLTVGLDLQKIDGKIKSSLELLPIKMNLDYQPYFIQDEAKEKVFNFLIENSSLSMELISQIKTGILEIN